MLILIYRTNIEKPSRFSVVENEYKDFIRQLDILSDSQLIFLETETGEKHVFIKRDIGYISTVPNYSS